jgi:hypothetical protein
VLEEEIVARYQQVHRKVWSGTRDHGMP